MSMPSRTTEGGTYRYGFNGKEKDTETDLNDFGARFYAANIGRWLSIDPLAANFPNWSPYNAMNDNPMFFIDPDGKNIIAPGQAAKALVLKTVTYMFGEKHGYSFEGDKLIHNGSMPKDLTKGQEKMFEFFNEALLRTEVETYVHVGTPIVLLQTYQGLEGLKISETAAGSTWGVQPASIKKIGKNGEFNFWLSARTDIIIAKSVIDDNGTYVATQGNTQTFVSPEHVLSHEFGHAIVDAIMYSLGGIFQKVDFNKMTEGERKDWAIRFTNTLLRSQNKPLETGEGQHGRNTKQPSPNTLKPITE